MSKKKRLSPAEKEKKLIAKKKKQLSSAEKEKKLIAKKKKEAAKYNEVVRQYKKRQLSIYKVKAEALGISLSEYLLRFQPKRNKNGFLGVGGKGLN